MMNNDQIALICRFYNMFQVDIRDTIERQPLFTTFLLWFTGMASYTYSHLLENEQAQIYRFIKITVPRYRHDPALFIQVLYRKYPDQPETAFLILYKVIVSQRTPSMYFFQAAEIVFDKIRMTLKGEKSCFSDLYLQTLLPLFLNQSSVFCFLIDSNPNVSDKIHYHKLLAEILQVKTEQKETILL